MPATAWYISLALIALIGVIFLYVGFGTARTADYATVQPRAYRIRAGAFWLLVIAGIAIVAVTMRGLPYLAPDAAAAAQTVNVTGSQWYWELDPATVKAGETVEFRVASNDVNHGFGIYDADDAIVAQVQAMPGYVNRLRVTFDRPGTYRIMCLEYCGIAHHAMISDLEVTAPGTAEGTAGAADSGAAGADQTND